jgi:hypothetical protein
MKELYVIHYPVFSVTVYALAIYSCSTVFVPMLWIRFGLKVEF